MRVGSRDDVTRRRRAGQAPLDGAVAGSYTRSVRRPLLLALLLVAACRDPLCVRQVANLCNCFGADDLKTTCVAAREVVSCDPKASLLDVCALDPCCPDP